MIRFGTLGAARITPRALIYPCIDEPRAAVVAVAARERARAQAFADFAQIPVVLDSYQQLVTFDRIDCVYNPLPISLHREWTVKALEADKHVLCEKSFAANADEAEAMKKVADATGKVVMDAFHYRYHPIFIRAKEIFDSGELGEIRKIDAAFHVPGNGIRPSDIRKRFDTAGGVTMDIGCYPISWVRHLTGQEPDSVAADAEVGPPNVDLMLRTDMTFPGGIRVTTSGDMRDDVRFRADMLVTGSEASMHVMNPLVPQTGNRITVTAGDRSRHESFDRRPSYAYQLDAFVDAVENGAGFPTDAGDAVRQMKVIDRAYLAAGLPVRGSDPRSG